MQRENVDNFKSRNETKIEVICFNKGAKTAYFKGEKRHMGLKDKIWTAIIVCYENIDKMKNM